MTTVGPPCRYKNLRMLRFLMPENIVLANNLLYIIYFNAYYSGNIGKGKKEIKAFLHFEYKLKYTNFVSAADLFCKGAVHRRECCTTFFIRKEVILPTYTS